MSIVDKFQVRIDSSLFVLKYNEKTAILVIGGHTKYKHAMLNLIDNYFSDVIKPDNYRWNRCKFKFENFTYKEYRELIKELRQDDIDFESIETHGRLL